MTLREAFEKLKRVHNANISYGPDASAPADVSFFFKAIQDVYDTAARRIPPLTQEQIDKVIENADVQGEEFIVIKLNSMGLLIGAKTYFGKQIRSNVTLENSHPGFLQKGDYVRIVGGGRYRVNTATDTRVTLK